MQSSLRNNFTNPRIDIDFLSPKLLASGWLSLAIALHLFSYGNQHWTRKISLTIASSAALVAAGKTVKDFDVFAKYEPIHTRAWTQIAARDTVLPYMEQTTPLQPQKQPSGETLGDWGDGEVSQTTLGYELELFDWDLFRSRRNDFPHIGIAGKTGGGKSWLAEYLASLFDGVVVAIAPHWNSGDFTSADLIAGWGRNYGTISDCENLTFEQILSGDYPVSACGFMGALIKEMNRRYQLDENQNFIGLKEPEIVVVLDEFNAWATEDKDLPPITAKLLREARKVKIRLIPLVQGTEVEAMGCKGQGQLRDQITWVMISNRAKQYASVNSKKAKPGTDDHQYWELIKQFLSVEKYPAFVGDLNPDLPAMPAQIPDLSEWKKSQPKLAKLAGWSGVTQPNPTPTPSVTTPDTTHHPKPFNLNASADFTPVTPEIENDDFSVDNPALRGYIREGVMLGWSLNRTLDMLKVAKGGKNKKYVIVKAIYDEFK